MAKSRWRFEPVTADRWKDLESLFGSRGACGGCWCMSWRLPHAEFKKGTGEGNRAALRKIVRNGPPPGLLAYDDEKEGKPVAWCAVAPRSVYVRLLKSRVLQPVDDRPVWSVSCFFVARGYRGQGLSVALLKAAAAFVRGQGGKILEGYPNDTHGKEIPGAFVWTGLLPAFLKAGFREVARRSNSRPIVRKSL